MNNQQSIIMEYNHLKLLKKLNNLCNENNSFRIKEIFNKQVEKEAIINDCIERIDKERIKLKSAEETENILKIEGSNFSKLAESFKAGDFKNLFRLIGVSDKITENIKEFESRYDSTLARTAREIETRSKNINDLMAKKNNAEANLEQSKINYNEELNNQRYIKTALESPDSKDYLIKALKRFASPNSNLGFSSEEISALAMIIIFPEQYGLTLNDIKKITFSEAEIELKNSVSDIFAMSKKEGPIGAKNDEDLLQRTSRIDYAKMNLVSDNKANNQENVKTVSEIIRDASLDLDKEELKLASVSNNQENILNILKYISKKGIRPSCFQYHIKSLIHSNFEEFEKICNELLNVHNRPLEDVETILGNILEFNYQEFIKVYNSSADLSDIFYKGKSKKLEICEDLKIGEADHFIEETERPYLMDLDQIDNMIMFPEVNEVDPYIFDEEPNVEMRMGA